MKGTNRCKSASFIGIIESFASSGHSIIKGKSVFLGFTRL